MKKTFQFEIQTSDVKTDAFLEKCHPEAKRKAGTLSTARFHAVEFGDISK